MTAMPYTYLIGWSKLDKFYYGVRYSKTCQPEDLWVLYFTSSKSVKKFRREHGEPDIIEIRKTFNDVKSAIIWEEKVLRKMNVLKQDKWLNKNIAGSIDPAHCALAGKISSQKRLEDKSHPFLRKNYQRNAQLKRIEDKTHNFNSEHSKKYRKNY